MVPCFFRNLCGWLLANLSALFVPHCDRGQSIPRGTAPRKSARMPMTPRDILEIQTAMDRYEKKFPRKPAPTPAEALAWKAGERLHSGKGSRIGIVRMLSLFLGARTRPG